jgi:hypothetical protein
MPLPDSEADPTVVKPETVTVNVPEVVPLDAEIVPLPKEVLNCPPPFVVPETAKIVWPTLGTSPVSTV